MFTNDELHMIKYALEHLHDTDLSNFKKRIWKRWSLQWKN